MTPAIKRVAAAFAIIAVFTYGAHFFRSGGSSSADFRCSSEPLDGEVVINIPAGASGSAVGEILYKAGVIASPGSYFRVAVGDSRSARVAPGAHKLNKKICASMALAQLLDHSRIPNLISITEGEWNTEIFTDLVKAGFSQAEVSSALRSVKLPKGITSSEGVLFPAQYSFADGTSAFEAVSSMVARFREESKKIGLQQGADGFSEQKLLIIASLIQAEGDVKDFSKISRVIRNRLKIGMPLQLDSTVHYLRKVRGNVFLSTNATTINSPYNTYKRYGLPPAPIGNPGIEAMKAALKPASGDWIYFITVKPGDTRFTSSGKEFLAWKEEYTKNRRSGAFK